MDGLPSNRPGRSRIGGVEASLVPIMQFSSLKVFSKHTHVTNGHDQLKRFHFYLRATQLGVTVGAAQ